MNKIVTYNPTQIIEKGLSIPAYFNQELQIAYKNEKLTSIIFIQQDLQDNLKDFNKFVNDYKQFMIEYNIPYVFFPYYIYFNKILPELIGKPNPKLDITIKKLKHINVVCAPAYGFLMLDLNKLKSINFKFDETLTELFWLQDLVEKCYQNKLWISNCCFIDRYQSWLDLKELTIKGYYINSEKYKIEKQKYDEKKIQYHGVQDFLNAFKQKYNLG